MIALQHLWPYLDQLKKECGYTQAEIGAAFLIASYAALYGNPKPSREGHRKALERINAILKRLTRLKAIGGRQSSLH